MTYRWPVVCVIALFFLSLAPIVPVFMAGAFAKTVNAPYVDDYYAPMAREVADGYPLMGNPFYFEHREGIAPAFILPFWIYAAPLMAGMPLSLVAEFNFTFWSLFFGILVYLLLFRLGLPGAWSAIGSIVTYALMYDQLLIPISMQLVHPVFVLFILSFFLWWSRPISLSGTPLRDNGSAPVVRPISLSGTPLRDNGSAPVVRPADKYRDAFLGFVAAYAIYDYTYMLQIISAFLGLVFVYLLLVRDWKRVIHALIVGTYSAVLCIPLLFLTFKQLHDPDYFESMRRIGLGYTHLPSGEVFYGAFRVLSFAALCLVSWRFIFKARGFTHATFVFQYLLLGLAIVVVSAGNVVTGLDLETASHAARFVMMWLVLGSVAAAYFIFSARSAIAELSIQKKIILSLFALSVLVSNSQYVASVDFRWKSRGADLALNRQALAIMPALQWLDAQGPLPKVIWTDPDSPLRGLMITSITYYTKHYLLYSVTGLLQLLPTSETEERYLVAHSLSNPTLESIATDVWDYDGVGAAIDTPNTINRSVKACRVLRLSLLGYECGTIVSARTLYAQHYAQMYARYKTEIQPHLRQELEKFHVTYIIKDTQTDTDFHPERLPNVKEVYSDDRFLIYKLQ